MQQFIDIPIGSQRLIGCLHTPPLASAQTPAPLVICCHGLSGSRMGTCYRFVTLARRLVEQNIACLRFDFRGCGESDGRFRDLTPHQLQDDLLAVVAAMDHRPDCDQTRLGIVASSFGALTTSHVASDLEHLRCLVYWAPVADIRALVDREMTDQARACLQKQGWLEYRGLRLGKDFFDGITDFNAAAELSRTPKPLLVFHAHGDTTVPFQQGAAYAEAMTATGAPTRLETLSGDDHGMRSVEANEQIIHGTVEWLTRFLQPGSTSDSTA